MGNSTLSATNVNSLIEVQANTVVFVVLSGLFHFVQVLLIHVLKTTSESWWSFVDCLFCLHQWQKE